MRQELAALLAAIRRHPDLARRLALIGSVAGVGEKTAVAILLRMPEIGRVTREQAAALAGLAPYDHESGEHSGERHIEGGRTRLRKALYAAALPAAFRWNAALVALYRRITARARRTRPPSSPAPENCSPPSMPWSPAARPGSQNHPSPPVSDTAEATPRP